MQYCLDGRQGDYVSVPAIVLDAMRSGHEADGDRDQAKFGTVSSKPA
jgi:hypothetical protein